MNYIIACQLERVSHDLHLDPVNGRRRGRVTGELLSVLTALDVKHWPGRSTVAGVNCCIDKPCFEFWPSNKESLFTEML